MICSPSDHRKVLFNVLVTGAALALWIFAGWLFDRLLTRGNAYRGQHFDEFEGSAQLPVHRGNGHEAATGDDIGRLADGPVTDLDPGVRGERRGAHAAAPGGPDPEAQTLHSTATMMPSTTAPSPSITS